LPARLPVPAAARPVRAAAQSKDAIGRLA